MNFERGLLEDKSKVTEIFIETIRPYYEEIFLDLENSYTEAKARSFIEDTVMGDFYQKIGLLFFNLARIGQAKGIPQEEIKIVTDFVSPFFSGGSGDSSQDFFSRLEPYSERAKQYVLQEMHANSIEEYIARESRKSLEDFLETKLEDGSFSIDDVFQELSRNHNQSLATCILEDVEKFKHLPEKTVSMKTLDLLIKDYISRIPSRVWRTSAYKNFSYDIHTTDDLTFLHAQTQKQGDCMIKRLEESKRILAHIDEVFKHFSKARGCLEFLRAHLDVILFADTKKLFELIQSNDHPSVISHYDVAILTGFLRSLVKLLEMEAEGTSQDITSFLEHIYQLVFFNVRLVSRFQRPPTLQKLGTVLTNEQETLYQRFLSILDASWEDCIEKATILAKEDLTPIEEKGLPLLGIGFAGPLFDETATVKENRVFLNFTSSFRSTGDKVVGSPFLYATEFLMHPDGITSRTFPYEFVIVENVPQSDLDVMDYITQKVIDFLCEPTADQTIHADVFSNLQILLSQRVLGVYLDNLKKQQDSLEAKMRNTEKQQHDLEKEIDEFSQKLLGSLSAQEERPIRSKKEKKERDLAKILETIAIQRRELEKNQQDRQPYLQIIEKISNGSLNLLTAQERTIIQRAVDQGKKRVCVETAISRLAGNPYTLSFAMGKTATETISHVDEKGVSTPFSFGKRTLIKPCETRCQIFSISHTLWADLNHFPNIDQVNERDKSHGGHGIELFSFIPIPPEYKNQSSETISNNVDRLPNYDVEEVPEISESSNQEGFTGDQVEIASNFTDLGNSWLGLERFDKATECYSQSLAIYKDEFGSESEEFKGYYMKLMALYENLGIMKIFEAHFMNVIS